MANKVTLTFAGDAKQLSKSFDKVSTDANKLQRSLNSTSKKFGSVAGKIAKGVAIGVGVGVVALGGFAVSALDAGEALNSIRSQTEAVVESTKGIANVSTKHVKEYSQELSNLAAVDRKLIESSQNVLLTFTNVRNEVGKGNDVFDQGSLAALNMSAALGQDLQSATTMVGKALNDPIQGINAMSRAGIQFTEQQKDQIKTMVESGDILGAQKVILGELETQFAGSAAANADASDKIKLAFSRITEEIGLKLLPFLDRFADWLLNEGIPAMEDFAGWVGDEIVPRLQDMAGWVGDNLVPALKDLGKFITGTVVPGLSKMAKWLGDNEDVMLAVGIGIAAVLVPAFIAWGVSAAVAAAATLLAMAPLILLGAAVAVVALLVIKHWDKITAATSAVASFLVDAFKGFIDWIKSNWPLLLVLLTGPIGIAVALIIKHWDTIMDGISAVKDWIADRIDDIVSFFVALPGRVVSFVDSIWESIKSGISGAKDWVSNRIDDIVSFFTGLPGRVGSFISEIWDKMKSAATEAKTWVRNRVDDIVTFFRNLPGRIASALSGLVDKIVAPFRDAYNKARQYLNYVPGVNLPRIAGPQTSSGRSFSSTPTPSRGSRPGAGFLAAKGAYVRQSPGGSLMTVGEGREDEAILPLSKLSAMLDGGGGTSRTIIELRSDGSEAGDFVVQVLRKSISNKGGTVQAVLG